MTIFLSTNFKTMSEMSTGKEQTHELERVLAKKKYQDDYAQRPSQEFALPYEMLGRIPKVKHSSDSHRLPSG